jgi:hypothetical protein
MKECSNRNQNPEKRVAFSGGKYVIRAIQGAGEMDWFDFDFDDGMFRKILRGMGRVLWFILDMLSDLFTFWEPWEKKRERKKKRKE